MLGPTIQGELVRLEPPGPEDLDLFREWMADQAVTRHLLVRFPPSRKQEEDWFQAVSAADDRVSWRIVVAGGTIGSCQLRQIDWINRGATSSLFIGDQSRWGKGYASEAVRLRTAFAFEELGLERLETGSLVENVGMHRALERAGYRKIAVRRRYVFKGGAWHDEYLFELLRADWESARGWTGEDAPCSR